MKLLIAFLRVAPGAALALATTASFIAACGADDANGATAGGGTPTGQTPSDAGNVTFPVTDGGILVNEADAGPPACRGDVPSTAAPQASPPPAPALTLAAGYKIETLATVTSPRHLAALPNGDLLVGTSGNRLMLIPGAEADGASGAATTFATLPESQAHGVTFARANCTVYAATTQGIHSMPYVDGQTSATPGSGIAKVRPGGGGGHVTTSLGFSQGQLYASVGSSCNACVETDPTRATIQIMGADGSGMTTRAKRIRNAIAVAVHPQTGSLWAGGAGQDDLPPGHPYEFLDPVTAHAGVADYGWPDCEENHVAYKAGADCSGVVVPRVVVPAYSTIIGAAFYPANQPGTFAFPASHKGGLFLSLHGSWHDANGKYIAAPRVVFVEMDGDTPKIPVDWADPQKQLTDFVAGFQLADGTTRIGRPSGVAVGARGSLFVADDQANVVYRIRPK